MSTPLSRDLFSKIKLSDFAGAEWIGLREVDELTTTRVVRNGKPDANHLGRSRGVYAEVLADGQFGYAAVPGPSEGAFDLERLRQAVDRAHAQARRAAKWGIHKFTLENRPPTRVSYKSPVQRPIQTGFATQDLSELMVKICERLRSDSRVVRAEAFVMTAETRIRMIGTNGMESEQEFSHFTSDFEATSQAGPVVQRRTDGGLRGRSLQGGWELLETPDLWDRVDRVREESIELLTAEECPTETTSLVLMPDQMMLQIHESIGHPLEMDRILGDERNYAGWSFVKPADFGTLQYGSKLLNVTFDPTVPGEYASYAVDDVGNPAKREFLIKDGILQKGLGSLESQSRMKVGGVANARASSWNRPPVDRMANLNVEPGTSSLEEILGSVRSGVMMTSNRSWSIDDFRNKFQFGCEYAKKIENGKLTRTLRNPNYRGVSLQFWRSLTKVGTKDTWARYGTPYCGKAEPQQSIRVGHASPVCLFEGVEVFGGAS